MEQEIIKSLLVSSPLAVAVIIVVNYLYRSGLLASLSSRLKKNGDDKRVANLEKWKELAESNHFRDLEELKTEFHDLQKEVKNISDRLIVVETRQQNSRH